MIGNELRIHVYDRMISCEYRVCYPIYGLKIVEDIDKEICCHATCRRPHQPVINPVSRSNIKIMW